MRWMRVLGVAAVLVGPVWGQVSAPAKPAAPVSAPLTLEQQIEGMQKKLADWAQLGLYREANAALPAPVAGERRVVFYGDSITWAWARTSSHVFPGKNYVGRGIGGRGAPHTGGGVWAGVVGRTRPRWVGVLRGRSQCGQ